jgi:amino acid adenylation domain-containing protein
LSAPGKIGLVPAVDAAAAYPLSAGQKSLWLLQQLLPNSTLYHIAFSVRIYSPLDCKLLRLCLQQIWDRHAALRTVFFIDESGALRQAAREGGPVPFDVIDAHTSAHEQLDQDIAQEFRRPFDLASGPLFRVTLFSDGPGGNVLILTAHHLVFDALSLVRTITELIESYSAMSAGATDPLLPVKATYRDFVEWQQNMLASDEGAAHLAFWRTELEGAPPTLDLPIDHARSDYPGGRGSGIWFAIDELLAEELRQLAGNLGIHLFDVFAATWQLLLFRYSGQTDGLTGFVVGGRPGMRFARTVGSFSNTVVLRARLDKNPEAAEFLQTQHHRLERVLKHQDYPFGLLAAELCVPKTPGSIPLVQTLFTYFTSRGSQFSELFVAGHAPKRIEIEAFAIESYGLAQDDLEFDLALTVAEGERCWCRMRFDKDLFEPATINRLSVHYINLLRAIVADPQQKVASLPMLTPAEREQIVLRRNRTQSDFPPANTPELIDAQFRRAPDHIAVVCDGDQLSYSELNARAECVAAYLRDRGVASGDLVGVKIGRSIEMPAALIGVWKAGAAYIPLDPRFPEMRIDAILADANPRLVLTTDDLRQAREIKDTRRSAAVKSDLAYVIYTSGSTGIPKGVEISHTALANLLQSMRQTPGIDETDVLLAVTTFSFDIAGLELFLPLTAGARVVIATEKTTSDGGRLALEIRDRRATIMQATPATWRLLLDAGWDGAHALKALCGGEAWPPALASELLPRVQSLWNMYGPTETTIWSSVHQVTGQHEPIPLGEPIANTSLWILDHALEPVAVGVAGELHIGGAGLARGYRNLRCLTSERFIKAPWGERLYKTGDQCRYGADGRIYFLGRLDEQIKLRGHRIEPGEIESALRAHPGVQQAAVIANSESGNQKLRAYIVSSAGESLDSSSLRELLSFRLPHYMVPAEFIYLDALPLTPSGKIDRHALHGFTAEPKAQREFEPPRTAVESALAALWSEMLSYYPVGLQDRFDELGGDSLTFALMTVRAGKRLGFEIPVRMDPQTLTLAGFAHHALSSAPRSSELPMKRESPGDRRKNPLGRILAKLGAALVKCAARIETKGIGDVPISGPAIIISNHISLFDFAILGALLASRRRLIPENLTFVIASKWRWLARPFASQLGNVIYVRRGEADFDSMSQAVAALRSGGTLAIMPEGRPTRGALTRAKPGVAYLARESGAPVWPLALWGHERVLDCWKKLRRVPVTVRLGAPSVAEPGAPSMGFQEQADRFMRTVAALMPPEYHGFYSSQANHPGP